MDSTPLKAEELIERKHAVKAKMKKLKAQKAQAQENSDKEKVEFLRKRLHSQRRVLRKIARKVKAQAKID